VSRAVRTASRIEEITFLVSCIPAPVPTEVQITPSEQRSSEDLVAHEVGIRASPLEDVFIDLTAFYNRYDNLSTNATGPVVCTNAAPITGPGDLGASLAGGNRLGQLLLSKNRLDANGEGSRH